MGLFKYLGLVFFLVSPAMVEAAELPSVEKGGGYEEIKPPRPTQDPSRVEIVEFFWYGCPHCYSFEPHLSAWSEKLPDNVEFIRRPVTFENDKWRPGAKAYFIAQELGITEKIHADFFNALHEKKRPLKTDEQLAGFFVEHGVTQERFDAANASFYVDKEMRKVDTVHEGYGVTGVPAVIINGKYRTNTTLAKSFQNMISVMNDLIAKESAKKD